MTVTVGPFITVWGSGGEIVRRDQITNRSDGDIPLSPAQKPLSANERTHGNDDGARLAKFLWTHPFAPTVQVKDLGSVGRSLTLRKLN